MVLFHTVQLAQLISSVVVPVLLTLWSHIDALSVTPLFNFFIDKFQWKEWWMAAWLAGWIDLLTGLNGRKIGMECDYSVNFGFTWKHFSICAELPKCKQLYLIHCSFQSYLPMLPWCQYYEVFSYHEISKD